MSTLNKIKIIEYTTTVLYDKKTKKIWVSKRTNPNKEFYEHWQSPGGHIEESDISAKWAARREVFEETGIYLRLEELNYWRTQHYYKEDQWRIVHCYKAEIKGIPNLTEPQEMTHWELKKNKEILKGPMIDSLKDIIRYPKENETKIIIIEGSCGAGKSTLAKKCKEYYKKQGLLTTLIDESFITQDPEQKLKKYAENLEKYRKNEITKEQMELLAIEWEKEIRDKWMSQIYFQVTNNLTGMKPDIIIMDRNLWSTIIFMKNMIKEGFFTEEKDEGKLRLRKIIGDGGIDLFGEIVIQNQTLQWIAQCKMTKQLENGTINEMKGLLSSRPNTIGIIIHGGNKSRQIESMIETANSDIFVCHIEELHMIRNQIEAKSIQRGIRTIAMTRMKVEEMEEVEFDIFGRITKAKKIKNVDIQTWGSQLK
ncbi:hypothetical protein Glove_18g135 [Diversispora epigaea]|uniref:Nudix hydrolase domain-containing protein n=1 Tax=Diversispora epigaea TaxID=1348612 RepID=A0A397JP55_9GLOM|nr:hypothetical protein Glove_18g135 [Diversispora epigaea]